MICSVQKMCATDGDRCISSERALFTWTRQWKNIKRSSFKIVLRNGFRGVAVLFTLASCFQQNCINWSSFKTVSRNKVQGVAALFAWILFSGKLSFDKLIFSAHANFLRKIPEKLCVEKQWLIFRGRKIVLKMGSVEYPEFQSFCIRWGSFLPEVHFQMSFFSLQIAFLAK